MKKATSRKPVPRRTAEARSPIAAINRDLERLLDRPDRPVIDLEIMTTIVWHHAIPFSWGARC